MSHPESAVITGAFSYTGRYVARRLLAGGVSVKTLTRRPDRRDPFGNLVQAAPWTSRTRTGCAGRCREPESSTTPIGYGSGAGGNTFEQAVENSKALFDSAAGAGVGRIVHFSVANASPDSWLPYFRGKGQVEEILKDTGLSYAIIRPTLVFGEGDLLLNNMAWALRRFPVFPVFGRGDYRLQPIYAGDLAAEAVEAGSVNDSFVADAAGPDRLTFEELLEELLRLLASGVGARVRLVHTPPSLGFALTRLVGLLRLRDVVLSRDEVDGLMAGLLTSAGAPTGTTRFAAWLDNNADGLGRRYVSELRRNWR